MGLTDRRKSPRFAVSLCGSVLTRDGYCMPVEVSSISKSGLQFTVDHSEMPKLLPNLSQRNAATPVPIELVFDIDTDEEQPPQVDFSEFGFSEFEFSELGLSEECRSIRIQCGIVYINRISIQQCSVGCRYEQFYGDSSERLEAYLIRLDDSWSSSSEQEHLS